MLKVITLSSSIYIYILVDPVESTIDDYGTEHLKQHKEELTLGHKTTRWVGDRVDSDAQVSFD